MIIVGAAEGGANAFGQFMGRKSRVRLDNTPLAIHPNGFNGVKLVRRQSDFDILG